MSFFAFRRRQQSRLPSRTGKPHRGILVFANTSEVIRAENLLKAKGWKIRVMGPPPEIRSGCDLVIEFPLMEGLNIQTALEEAGIPPLQMVPVSDPLLQPVDLFQIKDFGRHLMVRAANMKLTADKETFIIANVSGGGCPDVPYLAEKMVGKTLAGRPISDGYLVKSSVVDAENLGSWEGSHPKKPGRSPLSPSTRENRKGNKL